MNSIAKIYSISRNSSSSFVTLIINALYFKLLGKSIIASRNVFIRGLDNIFIKGVLRLGVNYRGFEHRNDIILLNIRGRLTFEGNYSIGKGCRFDVGEDAHVRIGSGGYINSNTLVIIYKGLTIGDNCSISWNCQFLDTDFHYLEVEGVRRSNVGEIKIGNNVWIGCNVKVYKNSVIPDGCVVASDSVVKTKFTETNSLIAGNPARIIKRNIEWK